MTVMESRANPDRTTTERLRLDSEVDRGILERGGGQGPQKGRFVGIFKLTIKRNSEGV